MSKLNLAGTFVTFLTLLGPQQVLPSFARMARTLEVRTVREVALAGAVGVRLFLLGLTALGVLPGEAAHRGPVAAATPDLTPAG